MKRKHFLSILIPFIFVSLIFLLLITRPIKIGVLFSLDSSAGNEENLAVQFYKNKYPQIGLRPVQLIVENPKLNDSSIKESYKKLDDKGVSIIIGAALSYAGTVIVNDKSITDVPFFSPSTSTAELSKMKDNFFRMITSNYVQGKYPAEYLNSLGYKNVLMLLSKQNRAYSEPLADAFIENFNGKAIKIFNDVNNPDPEWVISLNPDAIFFILPANETIQYLTPLYKKLPNTLRLTSSWGFQQLTSVFSGVLLNEMLVTTPTRDILEKPYDSLFYEFEEQFKVNPTFVSALTFSSMKIIYDAINTVGDDRKKLVDYLGKERVLDWAYGKVYIDSFGDSHAEYYYIYEIMNDELVLKTKSLVSSFNND